jgi:RNA polymerase sigma factor (sigma-70 family)
MNPTLALPRGLIDDNERIAAAVAAQAPRLRAFVRRQVTDLAEAEDIVQDTFAQLVAAYRLMEPVQHVAAWLQRVARNRIIDRFRRRAHEPLLIDDVAAGASDVLETWLAPAASGPEASYVREVLAEELIAALAELPAEQRAVFIAHELEGRSFKSLAADSGVGLSTLLGRKHAAVRYLRQRLEDIHSELEH